MEQIIIDNINSYTIEFKDNKLILTPKELDNHYNSFDDIIDVDLNCEIKNNENDIIEIF